MLEVVRTKAFRKDLKRAQKRGLEMSMLLDVVDILRTSEPLDPTYKAHPLKGAWIPMWELHLAPDWLLVYQITEDTLYLMRTGTHADLFKNN